jgi:hypothetical protein
MLNKTKNAKIYENLNYLKNKGWLDEVFIPKSQNPFSEAKDSPRPPTAKLTVPDNY